VTKTRIATPAQYLKNTGLLFALNRDLFHPIGLHLSMINIVGEPESEVGQFVIYEANRPEGFQYSERQVTLGEEKYNDFLTKTARPVMESRVALLGYLHQPSTKQPGKSNLKTTPVRAGYQGTTESKPPTSHQKPKPKKEA
jgi:hypothetical protein